ncbi:MAG: nucleotidyltransferase substrate binding protein [Candidatus Frackibacter sp. T328-2]|nr:MAG: nucleotidyltransferase substrate binding protein [Candidatus Frackibacter sp. T328-2]
MIRMNKNKWEERLASFKKVLNRLEEGLEVDSDNLLMIDGVIQRFEFNYELAWKTMKCFLKSQGIEDIKSPRITIREASSFGLIVDSDQWIDMLEDKKLTADFYDEEQAKKIYARIKEKYYENFKDLYERLKDEEAE